MNRMILLLAALLFSVQSVAADKIEVMLDWFVNPDHAQLVIAAGKGFFSAQDLEVTMIEPADPSMPPKLVAAGKTDVAISYQPQLHVQIDKGLPLTRIATLVATPLNSLVVLADGPIKSLADLKGKKIGFSIGGFDDALLKAMLNPHGIALEDVELINVNWSLSPSLVAGKVDAVIGAYRNFELNQMDIEGHPGRAFFVEEEGVPAYDELILIVNNKDRDNKKYHRFVKALELATQFIINHPDEAWDIFKAYKPKDLDNELNKRAWRDTLRRFALRPGALDIARYQHVGAFMQTQGLTQSNPDVSTNAIQP